MWSRGVMLYVPSNSPAFLTVNIYTFKLFIYYYNLLFSALLFSRIFRIKLLSCSNLKGQIQISKYKTQHSTWYTFCSNLTVKRVDTNHMTLLVTNVASLLVQLVCSHMSHASSGSRCISPMVHWRKVLCSLFLWFVYVRFIIWQ